MQTNGYLVETPGGNFLIDAPFGIAGWVDEKGVRVDGLFLTHQHYDHVEDLAALQEKGVKVHAWSDYSKDLTLESYGAGRGVPEVRVFQVDTKISAGRGDFFGKSINVSHVPGHSPDSVSFSFEEDGIVFAGDALFAGSVGRCDLPEGDFDLLISGIRRELLSLPDETKVYSGHGPATTIGRERISNGFLR